MPQGKPQADPIQAPRQSTMQRFWRIFRLLAFLSIVVAAIAVALVTAGAGEVHASLIIATALGVGLTMLLGSALMVLMFLSSESGHDDAASHFKEKDKE
jgi:hypothetical protein